MSSPSIELATEGTYCDKNIQIEAKLQTKTITQNGTYTSDEGYVGFNEVTVDVGTDGSSGAPSIEGTSTVKFIIDDEERGYLCLPDGTELVNNPYVYKPADRVFKGWLEGNAAVSFPYTLTADTEWKADL